MAGLMQPRDKTQWNFLTGLLTGGIGAPGDMGQAAQDTSVGLLNARMQSLDPTGRMRAMSGMHSPLQGPEVPYGSPALQKRLGGDPQAPESLLGAIGAPEITDIAKGAGLLSKLGTDLAPGGLLAQALFHGTPHKFDKFDLKAIGTGEGAQAYGHGLYFAESPGVAKNYRARLSGRGFKADNVDIPEDTAARHVPALNAARNGTLDDYIANATKELEGAASPTNALARMRKEDITFAESIKGKKITQEAGHLYEVDIPDETIGKMLDWDAPLSEQPESVRKALTDTNIFDDIDAPKGPKGDPIRTEFIADDLILTADNDARLYQDKTLYNAIENYKKDPSRMTNRNVINRKMSDYPYDRDIYKTPLDALEAEKGLISMGEMYKRTAGRIGGDTTLGKHIGDSALMDQGQVELSRKLNEAGIPGIRFFDGSSRAKGEGTRNIVVFNPDDIRKVKRDGELVYDTGKKGGLQGLLQSTVDKDPRALIRAESMVDRKKGGLLGEANKPLRGEVDGKLTAASDRRQIAIRARERFGLTDNFKEAGYIRSDGTMLDFSGKADHGDYIRQGDRYTLKPGARFDDLGGNRVTDHRDISFVFDGGTDSTTDDMLEYQKRMRNVRVDFNGNVASANFKPTDKQLEVMSDGFFGKQAVVEFDHPRTGQTIASADFDSPSKSQLKRFFNDALRKVD